MKQTISVLVENQAGVLNRITGLFSRRAFNIESLAVGVTDDPTISRITIIVDSGNSVVEQVEKQLNKLIEVIKVRTLEENSLIGRELMILKVNANKYKAVRRSRAPQLLSHRSYLNQRRQQLESKSHPGHPGVPAGAGGGHRLRLSGRDHPESL